MTPLAAGIAKARLAGICLLLAGLAVTARHGWGAEFLLPWLDGDRVRVSAPRFRFLTGKPLDRLRNGASVAFHAQLGLQTDRAGPVVERAVERCVVSYDLWEEKFSVSILSRPARSVSHLSATAAEAWCLESLTLPLRGLAPDKPFWLRLELRVEDPKDRPAVVGESGINLTRLIELFSRPSRGQQLAWVIDDGPFRLADLNKAKSRGSGAG